MKRIAFFALLSVLCLTAFARGKQPAQFKNLPKPVQTVVKKTYTQEDVQFITCEKTAPKHFAYQLVIADGTSLEYNDKGELLKAKNAQGVQEVFIPKEVNKYIKKNFPNATVTKYEKETFRQVVSLNDALTLIFNSKGKFIRIED